MQDEIKNYHEGKVEVDRYGIYKFKEFYYSKHPEKRLNELGSLISRIGKLVERTDKVNDGDMKKLLASLSVISLDYSILTKDPNNKKGIEMFDELIDYIEPIIEKYN